MADGAKQQNFYDDRTTMTRVSRDL